MRMDLQETRSVAAVACAYLDRHFLVRRLLTCVSVSPFPILRQPLNAHPLFFLAEFEKSVSDSIL